MSRTGVLIIAACLLAGAVSGAFYLKQRGSDTAAPPKSPPAPTGNLTGVARYYGTEAPRLDETRIDGQREVFDTESLVVDPQTHGLRWVIIRVLNAPTMETP